VIWPDGQSGSWQHLCWHHAVSRALRLSVHTVRDRAV